MFIAKYIDKKQGEKKVVDQKQALRARFEQWLGSRPSPKDLALRGILIGSERFAPEYCRTARFAIARDHIDRFLRHENQKQAEKVAKIPAGSFSYTDRVHALLGSCDEQFCSSIALEQELESVHRARDSIRGKLQVASDNWARASDDCLQEVCTGALRDAATNANRALGLLEAHQKSTDASLSDVFSNLRAFQRLAAKKTCLQGILSVVEKTDDIQKAVITSCSVGRARDLLSTLEELPELCAALPSRCQAVGVSRVQFLISPLRSLLVQELQKQLAMTRQWPSLDSKAQVQPNEAMQHEVVQLCADLQRIEQVLNDVKHRVQTTSRVAEDAKDNSRGSWVSSALVAPLIARFHQLFNKDELNRMDKPEWPLQYLVKIATDYGELVSTWVATSLAREDTFSGIQRTTLKRIDFRSGLAIAMACEAKLVLRRRIPLLAEPDERSNLLHTLQHVVRFHGEISAIGGPPAAIVAFEDFDKNRPLREPEPVVVVKNASSEAPTAKGSASLMEGLAHLQQEKRGLAALDIDSGSPLQATTNRSDKNSGRSLGGLGFMAELSHLRKGDQELVEEKPAQEERSVKGKVGAIFGRGLSKLNSLKVSSTDAVTAAVDSTGVVETVRSGADGLVSGLSTLADTVIGEANESEPEGFLDVWIGADSEFICEKLRISLQAVGGGAWRRRPVVKHVVDGVEGTREEPEAFELATLIPDLFDKSRLRAECFSSTARGKYSERVLGAGLRQAVDSLRDRWLALADPLKDAGEAAVIVESLTELCRYFDRFSLGVHFISSVDETSTLQLEILERLADLLVGAVRQSLRQLTIDTNIFSYIVAPTLILLSKRLRTSNFLILSRRTVKHISDLLLRHLLWHAPFTDRDHIEAFTSNCRDDLCGVFTSVLDVGELRCCESLWDGCSLLALPDQDAKKVLVDLRRVAKCSPTRDLRSTQDQQEPENQVEDTFVPLVGGEVLKERRAKVFAEAGVKELPVTDAISILGKRPELAGSLSDLEDSTLGVIRDLLPTPAFVPTAAVGAVAAAAEQIRPNSKLLRSISAVGQSVGQVASTLRPLKK